MYSYVYISNHSHACRKVNGFCLPKQQADWNKGATMAQATTLSILMVKNWSKHSKFSLPKQQADWNKGATKAQATSLANISL